MTRVITVLFLCLYELCVYSQDGLKISHSSGLYDTSFILTVSGDFDKICYTDDGSLPNKYSKRWKDSLEIDEHFILRLKFIQNGKLLDTVVTRFFLINFSKKLPILSIAMDPDDLWDEEKGMYVRGINSYLDTNGHYRNCNYHKRWEKKIQFLYFEDDSMILSQDCGIKLFGESTRAYQDKSLKIIARKKYGKKSFKHDFFITKSIKKHKQLVIRTSGNDYRGSRFKDVLSAYLVRNLGIDYMAFQPVHVFINAEYWGLYNLREKINEHYLRYNKGLHQDSVSIIMGKWVRQQGSSKRYMEMYRWFNKLKDVDSIAYVQANQYLDIRNYINFRIFQIYINNLDSRGNIRYWNSTQGDGKFRMMLYDTDHGYGYYNRNFLEKALSNSGEHWYNPRWSTLYLRKLMKNADFKNEFLVQYAHLLNSSLHKDSIISAVDYLENMYIDELPRPGDKIAPHLRNVPLKEKRWLRKVDELRKFAKLRHNFVKKELIRLFEADGWFTIEISGLSGKISINGNYAICLPFKGEYIKGFDFEIKAEDDGYFKFKNWSNGDTSRTIIVKADSDQQFFPVYEYIEPIIEKPLLIEPDVIIKKESTNYKDLILYIGYVLIAIGCIALFYVFYINRNKKSS